MTFSLANPAGGFIPSANGLSPSFGPLPGTTEPQAPIFIVGTFTMLGTWGSGNPAVKAQVKRTPNGPWVDVLFASVANVGTGNFFAYGVAFRFVTPALTGAGTDVNAPRLAWRIVPQSLPFHHNPSAVVSLHKFGNDLGVTGEYLSLPGFGQIHPDGAKDYGVPFQSLVVLTQVGAGTSFIESTYRDSDGAKTIQEGSAITGVSGQTIIRSYADSHRVDFTDGTGTTDVWLDVLQVPI